MRRAFFLAATLSVLVSSTVASPDVYAQADQAFDPTDEDLKGEGLIGPPVFNQPSSCGSDIETIPGSATEFNGMNGGGYDSGTPSSWAPPSVPVWQHPSAQRFHEPLSNSRSAWQPIQSGSAATQAPPMVHHPGANDEAWNLWLNMAQQQKQPSSPSPAYGAAAQIAGFGRQQAPDQNTNQASGQTGSTFNNTSSAFGQNTSSTQSPQSDHNAITSGAGWTQSNIYSGWNSAASGHIPPGRNTDYVPVPPPQQVAGQMMPPQTGWAQPGGNSMPPTASWVQPPQAGQWAPGGQPPQSAWQAPIGPGQQVPSNNSPYVNQTPTFNLGTSAMQPVGGAQPMGTSPQSAPQGDFIGGFMNWLGQMPNPFNQGQGAPQGNGAPPVLSSIFPQGMPDLSGLQQAASSFSLPNMTPTDPNNPLSSPMASCVAGAIGSWVSQQMRSSNPFQLGSTMPQAMPAASSLPNLFPTDLKLEANGESTPKISESQNILDSELADSLLSNNDFPANSNSGSQTYSSRPTSFRGPLGIPVPGLLGNALASQRNRFAVNYLLNRSLRGSGFGIRLR